MDAQAKLLIDSTIGIMKAQTMVSNETTFSDIIRFQQAIIFGISDMLKELEDENEIREYYFEGLKNVLRGLFEEEDKKKDEE